jgi:hypothetical protein
MVMAGSDKTAGSAKDETADQARRTREKATDAAEGSEARAMPERDNEVKREGAERAANAAMANRPAG